MKRVKYILMVLLAATISSCNYLNVVPDGVVEISSKFTTQSGVRSALGKCYEYLPSMQYVHGSVTLAGDEYCCPTLNATFTTGGSCRGLWLVRGLQSATNVSLDFWTGNGGGQNLYEGIRYCNVFLDNIQHCVGVPKNMINDWIAQVRVLRAYYHFFLIQCYGPILIYDHTIDLSASVDQMRAERKPLEECFQFVIGELNAALSMPDFKASRCASSTENLLLDKVKTKAILAKVMLLRASPIFNGNILYNDFKLINANTEGTPLWRERWEDAAEACQAAVEYAEQTGNRSLYEAPDKTPYDYDMPYYDVETGGSEIIRYCYALRSAIVEANVQQNKELIWGSGLGANFSGDYTIQTASQIRTGQLQDAAGIYYNDDGNTKSSYSFGWLGASLEMCEAFYSKNGVPISMDSEYDYAGRYDLTRVPTDTYHLAYMAAGHQTVKLHLNREPRFYAWLLVDRSCYRDYNRLIPLISMLYADSSAPGGGTAIEGSSNYDLLQTGIGIKKMVHPESKNYLASNVKMYPFPLIRLADLYLMYAEALCMLGDDLGTAAEYVNKVRARAGLKPLNESWDVYTSLNSGNQADLMEMIKWERRVELCFEGHRYFDVVRWLEGDKYFNSPIRGWNYKGTKPAQFYTITNMYSKQWSNKNYLWPLTSSEIDKNPRLVQNPWW